MNISIKREQNNARISSAEREKFGAKLKTKTIFKALAMAMLMPTMLLTTACSSEDDLVNNTANTENTINKGYALPVTVNVTRQDGATRASFDGSKLNFSAEDKLFVSGSATGAGQFAGTLTWQSGGTFSGTIYTKNLYEGTIDDLLNGNYATLLPAGYESYDYLEIIEDENEYEALLGENAYNSFATSKKLAVEQLSYEHGEYTSGTGFVLMPQNAILNFTITGLTPSTKVTAALSDDEDWTPDIEGEVTTDGSGNATFAIGLEDGSDLNEFSLSVAGNAIALVSSSKVLEAGKIYNITRSAAPALTYPIALSAVTSDYIGSVVTTDGYVYPAKTAVPAGKTAVGILGKVTETGHGLILALQDATQQKWNTTIYGWTSDDTYAGTTLKQLPAGALGSLTSYTKLGSVDVSNWCLAQKNDYEAIFINLGSAKHDGDGYTYDANVNAYITTGVGGTAISGSGIYWSATEDGSNVWAFSSDFWNRSGKGYNRSLRPVLGF